MARQVVQSSREKFEGLSPSDNMKILGIRGLVNREDEPTALANRNRNCKGENEKGLPYLESPKSLSESGVNHSLTHLMRRSSTS